MPPAASHFKTRTLLLFGLLLASLAFVLITDLSFFRGSGRPKPASTEKKELILGPNWEDYANPDGTRTHVISQAATRYYDDAIGQWQPIDPTVRPTEGDFGYANETNVASARFETTLDPESLFRYELKGRQLTYGAPRLPNLQTASAVVENNVVTYPDTSPGIDVRYTVDAGQVLEEIVLKEKKDITTISQVLRADDLDVRAEPDGRLIFRDAETKADLFAIPKPLLYEEKDRTKVNDGIRYSVRREGDHFLLTRTITAEGRRWLSHATYPVVIDATTTDIIMQDLTGEDIELRDNGAGVPNDTRMSYFKFNISSIPANQVINSVQFSPNMAVFENGITTFWDEDALFWHVGDNAGFNSQTWTDSGAGLPTPCNIWNAAVDTQITQTSAFGTLRNVFFRYFSDDIKGIFNVEYNAGRTYLTLRVADPDAFQATCPANPASLDSTYNTVGDLVSPNYAYVQIQSSENQPNTPQLRVNYTPFPNPPLLLTMDPVTSAFNLNFRWTDNSTDEDGFFVYESDTSGGPSTNTYSFFTGFSGGNPGSFAVDCDGPSPPATSKAGTGGGCTFTRLGLAPLTTKFFKVRAYKNDPGLVESIDAGPINGTTLIYQPSNVTLAVPSAVASHVVTWNDSSGDENSWIVERSPSGSLSWTTQCTAGTGGSGACSGSGSYTCSTTQAGNGGLCTFTDAGLSGNAPYYYRVSTTSIAYGTSSPVASTPASRYTLAALPVSAPTVLGDNATGLGLRAYFRLTPNLGAANPAGTKYRTNVSGPANGANQTGFLRMPSPCSSGINNDFSTQFAATSEYFVANQPPASGRSWNDGTQLCFNTNRTGVSVVSFNGDFFPQIVFYSNNRYTFSLTPRNEDLVDNPGSPPATQAYTPALAPNVAPPLSNIQATSIRLRLSITDDPSLGPRTERSNPDSASDPVVGFSTATRYAIEVSTDVFVSDNRWVDVATLNDGIGLLCDSAGAKACAAPKDFASRADWDGVVNDKLVTINGLLGNTNYYFRLRPMNGDSYVSAAGVQTSGNWTLSNPPGVLPNYITANPSSSTVGLDLSWSANGNAANTEHVVEWSTANTFSPLAGSISIYPPCSGVQTCSYTISGLSPNVGYYVRIKTRNQDGPPAESAYTYIGSASTPGNKRFTHADTVSPTLTVTCLSGAYECDITWARPASGVSKYGLYRAEVSPRTGSCPVPQASYTKVTEVTNGGASVTYQDIHNVPPGLNVLLPDTRYCYKISSFNDQTPPPATAPDESPIFSATGTDYTAPATPRFPFPPLPNHSGNGTDDIHWSFTGGSYPIEVHRQGSGALVGTAAAGFGSFFETVPTPNFQSNVYLQAVNSSHVPTLRSPGSSPGTAYAKIETPSVAFGTPNNSCGSGAGGISPTCIEVKAASGLTNLDPGPALGGSGVNLIHYNAAGSSIVAIRGWQSGNPVWTRSGLSVNSKWTFLARARNGDGGQCIGGPANCQADPEGNYIFYHPNDDIVSGVQASRYTLAQTPTMAPGIDRQAPISMVATIGQETGANNNDTSSTAVEYAILASTDGTNYNLCAKEVLASPSVVNFVACAQDNSDPVNHPNGRMKETSLPAPLLWKTKTAWNGKGGATPSGTLDTATVKIDGLQPGLYYMKFRARNGDPAVSAPADPNEVETLNGQSSQLFLVKNNTVGWLWSSNAGWISLNCLNFLNSTKDPGGLLRCDSTNGFYGANVDFLVGRSVNPLSGYGWSPQVGWMSFNRKACSNDTSLACYDNADCSGGGTCVDSSAAPVTASSSCDDPATVGVTELCGFGSCSLDPKKACQEVSGNASGTCGASGTCRVTANAAVNGSTREVQGWGRFLAEKVHGEQLDALGGASPCTPGTCDWGWTKLAGKWGAGSTDRYFWQAFDVDPKTFLSNNPAFNPGGVALFSPVGWGWDRGQPPSLTDVGYGWIQARGEGTLVSIPYLQTFFSDVYAGGNIRLAPPPRGLGSTCGPGGTLPCETATYLILANGLIQGIAGYFPGTMTPGPSSALPRLPSNPPAIAGQFGQPLGSNPVAKLDVASLTTFIGSTAGANPKTGKDRFYHTLWEYPTGNKLATDIWGNLKPLTSTSAVLGAKIYHVQGDFTIDDPNTGNATLDDVKFANSSTGGAGLVVVDGDLHVRTNVRYDILTTPTKLADLASLGVIVKGNIYIDPAVSSLVGAYVAVGENDEDGQVFSASRGYRISQSTDDAQADSGGGFANNQASLTFGWNGGTHNTTYLRYGPIDLPKTVCSNDVSLTCTVVGDCPAATPPPTCSPPTIDSAEVRFEAASTQVSSFSDQVGVLGSNAPADGSPDSVGTFSANPSGSTEIIGAATGGIGVCSQNPLALCVADVDCGTGNTCTVPWKVGERHVTPNVATFIVQFITRSGYVPGSDYLGLAIRHSSPPPAANPGNQFRQIKSFEATTNPPTNPPGIRGERPSLVIHYSTARKQLTISGLLVARHFTFERQFVNQLQPAEKVIYDGRVIANTPPGLEDFTNALPTYQQVVP